MGFLLMTMGRTAWMVAAFITVCYGIFVMHGIRKEKWAGIIVRGVCLFLLFLLLFPVVFGTVRWIPTILHHPVWYEGEYAEWRVMSWDPADSEKYVDMDEFLEILLGRIGGTVHLGFRQGSPVQNSEDLKQVLLKQSLLNTKQIMKLHDVIPAYLTAGVLVGEFQEKLHKYNIPLSMTAGFDMEKEVAMEGHEGMDESLRYRLTITKSYLSDLRFLGHKQTEGHFHVKGTDYTIWHAQNIWLQMAYYYGIPAGILFIVLTYFLLRRGAILLQSGENREFCIIPLFVTIVFFLFGSMEIVWLNGQFALFLIYFVQWPEIGNKE